MIMQYFYKLTDYKTQSPTYMYCITHSLPYHAKIKQTHGATEMLKIDIAKKKLTENSNIYITWREGKCNGEGGKNKEIRGNSG